MKNFTGKFWSISAALFLLLGILTLAGESAAQTKKKTTKKKTPASVPQPVPEQNYPVIISQADPYQNQQLTPNTDTPVENQTPGDTTTETFDEKLERVSSRVRTLESSKQSGDEKQKRLLLNLDILTRAEQRAESLRKQLFELMEKESTIRTKLDTIEFDLRPDMIDRQIAFAGSLRPEQLRETKRKSLEAEKRNLEALLAGIQSNRTNLEQNVQRADQLVEKLRAVLEKDIDDTLNEQPKEPTAETKDQ